MTATAPSSEPLVQVEGLHTYYGKSHILHGVTLEVGRGEVVGLIGQRRRQINDPEDDHGPGERAAGRNKA